LPGPAATSMHSGDTLRCGFCTLTRRASARSALPLVDARMSSARLGSHAVSAGRGKAGACRFQYPGRECQARGRQPGAVSTRVELRLLLQSFCPSGAACQLESQDLYCQVHRGPRWGGGEQGTGNEEESWARSLAATCCSCMYGRGARLAHQHTVSNKLGTGDRRVSGYTVGRIWQAWFARLSC